MAPKTTMAPKKRKKAVVDWKKSQAKAILLADLRGGVIGLDTPAPRFVWAFYENRPEFVGVTSVQLKRSLYALRNNMRARQARIIDEEAMLLHDMALFPRSVTNHRGEPHWDLSDAKPFLEQDITDGKNKEMPPRELWMSRPEYLVYGLKTFRNHIYQAIRTIKFQAYLESKGWHPDDADDNDALDEAMDDNNMDDDEQEMTTEQMDQMIME
jgi:hypothetical protein